MPLLKLEKRSIIRAILWLLLLAPMIVKSHSYPPPYYRYRVAGQVERAGGGNVEDLPIVMLYSHRSSWVDSLAIFSPASDYEASLGGTPIDLTDNRGRFALDVRSVLEFDTLAVAVLFPDHALFPGDTLAANSVESIPVERLVDFDDGCCSSEGLHTEGYVHNYPDQTIVMP